MADGSGGMRYGLGKVFSGGLFHTFSLANSMREVSGCKFFCEAATTSGLILLAFILAFKHDIGGRELTRDFSLKHDSTNSKRTALEIRGTNDTVTPFSQAPFLYPLPLARPQKDCTAPQSHGRPFSPPLESAASSLPHATDPTLRRRHDTWPS